MVQRYAQGTVENPLPNHTSVMEPKVKWGAIATYVVSAIVLLLVELFTANENQLLIEALPDVYEAFILPLVPTITTLAVGYSARHQWRQGEVTNVPNSNTTTR